MRIVGVELDIFIIGSVRGMPYTFLGVADENRQRAATLATGCSSPDCICSLLAQSGHGTPDGPDQPHHFWPNGAPVPPNVPRRK